MPSILGGNDAISDLGEVAPYYIRSFDERIEGLPGDEGGAPCAQSPRNVPGMDSGEAHTTLGDLQRPRGHPVGGWRRFERFAVSAERIRSNLSASLAFSIWDSATSFVELVSVASLNPASRSRSRLSGTSGCGGRPRSPPRISCLSASSTSTPNRSSVIMRAAPAASPNVVYASVMVATNADCSIWLNHSLRTETWPKIRSKSGSSAARSSRVSFTSKTQTLFTTFLSQQRSAKVSPSREPRQAEMLTSAGLKGPKRADERSPKGVAC